MGAGANPQARHYTKRLSRGKPRGAIRPALARLPSHSVKSASCRVRPAGSSQRKPLGQRDRGQVGQPAILCRIAAGTPFATAHFRQILQGEYQKLPVFTHAGQMIACNAPADHPPRAHPVL